MKERLEVGQTDRRWTVVKHRAYPKLGEQCLELPQITATVNNESIYTIRVLPTARIRRSSMFVCLCIASMRSGSVTSTNKRLCFVHRYSIAVQSRQTQRVVCLNGLIKQVFRLVRSSSAEDSSRWRPNDASIVPIIGDYCASACMQGKQLGNISRAGTEQPRCRVRKSYCNVVCNNHSLNIDLEILFSPG
jgi:hypothetical protein